MAIKVSPHIRNTILSVITEGTSGTTGTGGLSQLDIYTFSDGGGPPANADAGTEGTLVASIPITWEHGTDGTSHADFYGSVSASAAGTVGYGRLASSGRVRVIQGSAGTSLSADFVIDKEIITVAELVNTIGRLVQPAE